MSTPDGRPTPAGRPAATAAAAGPRRQRLVGVDAARGLALLGMMGTHLVSRTTADGSVSWVYEVFSGRASALFAVLAGVGLALATGRTDPPRGRELRAARAGVLARAAVVAGVGLLVGLAPGYIYVILVYYGLLFAIGSLFVGLRWRALAVLGGTWLLVGPVVARLVRPLVAGPGGAPTFDVPDPTSLLSPLQLLTGLLVTGVYPVLTWTGYLLVGMAVGRLPLQRAAVAGWLAATGAVAAVVAPLASAAALGAAGGPQVLQGQAPPSWQLSDLPLALETFLPGATPTTTWAWLLVDTPHSATPFDLVGTTGSALAVLGLALLVGRSVPWLLAPLAGAGAMTLTLYSLHVVTSRPTAEVLGGEAAWLFHAGAAVVVGLAVRESGRRGPLEAVAAAATRAARDLVLSRSATR
ncbi:heparan-alpha-glucosaminide N-acetyltransferase domain-containing protein [Quadrisphaera sp. KR29]|uniref:heparan-alpha-glucosaminide N-acetyltransferase domain-containing protein n=1 Tax=Quadrisphaera sp. KR29 TaxID=3461391 RepID=UPI004043AD4F